MFRILVCGSRKWTNSKMIANFIDVLHPDCIIEGEAPGADVMSRYAAEDRGIEVLGFVANWNAYGKSAGIIRNKQMLNEGLRLGLHLVVAFSNDLEHSRGTSNMVEISRKAGIPVMTVAEGLNGTSVVGFIGPRVELVKE